MALLQFFAVLLLASAMSAQRLTCSTTADRTVNYDWNPAIYPTIEVHTVNSTSTFYSPNSNCIFIIRANNLYPGRVVVRVVRSDLVAYSASIDIRTEQFSGFLASWSQLTYNEDRHKNFVGLGNRLYISFASFGGFSQQSTGVQLTLTFLSSTGCLPSWTPVTLAGSNHCVGVPLESNSYQFGSAQRYCNLYRANLLVSDRNNVTTALGAARASNVWIGMTAEPSGSVSFYRWINNNAVGSNVFVQCGGGCRPGSTTHRCVYALNSRDLMQIECSQLLRPLCYMPAGGTDTFYAGSAAVKASGALLVGAMALFWSLH